MTAWRLRTATAFEPVRLAGFDKKSLNAGPLVVPEFAADRLGTWQIRHFAPPFDAYALQMRASRKKIRDALAKFSEMSFTKQNC